MKIFNTFGQLAEAKVLTGTPVRVLEPALIDGVVEATGEGLSLLSGNVFVPSFGDQESITARKTSLLDDAFTGGISAYINTYKKDNSGNWVAAADGRTSAVFYAGQVWWPLVEIPYTPSGYLITSWGLPTGNPDILEVTTSIGTVFQFNRFTGLIDGGNSGGSTISDTPPINPLAGNRWTRCSDMKSFIWYVDNNGSQWVEDNPSMGASFETSLVTVADKQELSELNIPRLTHIVTSSDGKTYEVRESNLGLENTPDKVKLPDGRYANRVGGYKPSALGNFKTSSNLNHRCGDFEYRKHSNSSAELLTDLSRFKAYTLDDLQFSGVTVAYADWTKGNDDAGDGLSWATAKASITQALALGTDVVLLRAGQYNRVNRLNSMTVTKDVAIIAVGGTAAVSMLATGTWSKTAGQTNVYQLDYQSGLTNVTSGVYDTTYLTNLAPTAFTPVASIALVEATPNSFFHTGATTYVHTADNRDMTLYPNSLRLVQPVATPTFTFTGNHKLYMEGIEFWGGNGGGTTFVSDGGEYKDSVVYAKNCKFNGNQDGASNGVNVRDIGLAIFEQCEASANRRDGFNYHAWLQGSSGVTGLNSHFVEINCRAHNNGLGGSESNNQGSTSHEDCVGFRINGDYSNHPDGGCIVDIQATKCYLVSCTASNSGRVGMHLAADGFDRGNGVQYAEWWVDGAFMRGNTPEAAGGGDLALDGYYSVLHFRDTDTDKPLVTRAFSDNVQAPDEDFN